MKDIQKALQKGERKEVADGGKVAKAILKNTRLIQDLLQVLKDNTEDPIVVSHGFYALKEASLDSEEVRKKALRFCRSQIDMFSQWEARENFLRICLVRIEKDEVIYKLVLPMLKDASAIVQTYASEYLIRYNQKFEPKSVGKMLKKLDSLATKASVKARIKKLKKELKIESP